MKKALNHLLNLVNTENKSLNESFDLVSEKFKIKREKIEKAYDLYCIRLCIILSSIKLE